MPWPMSPNMTAKRKGKVMMEKTAGLASRYRAMPAGGQRRSERPRTPVTVQGGGRATPGVKACTAFYWVAAIIISEQNEWQQEAPTRRLLRRLPTVGVHNVLEGGSLLAGLEEGGRLLVRHQGLEHGAHRGGGARGGGAQGVLAARSGDGWVGEWWL